MSSGDTYAIHHMGETTWLSGSTAVARWLCDNYGLKLDRMPRLVEQTEAHRKLANEDLGLRIVNMSKPLRELHSMLVHCEGKLEPRPFTVNASHRPGRLEPELREGEACWYSVDGSAHVVKGVW